MCKHQIKEKINMSQTNKNPWVIQLITPNHPEAQTECKKWMHLGYSTHYSQSNKQVEIKKRGPGQSLYFVRTRTKK
tara:strand:- start:305 stop:532 length:228 start_codon:yes stop_codon:yes gene_type:complete